MAKKLTLIFLGVFLLGVAGYFYFSNLEKRKASWKILENRIIKECDDFPGEAAVIVKDLNAGWQIRIKEDKLFPSASLVKIPIMASCFYAAGEGRISLEETLKLKAGQRALGSGRLKDAPAGAEFSISELIEDMITQSDNTATNMLIERIGIDCLNDYFKKLGLKDTNISRPMMDFKSRKEGRENFTTASDLAGLLEKIYNGRLISRNYSKIALELLKKQKINDRIPARLPPYTVVAHKTGLENAICHDAGIVFSPKGNFLLCVLIRHKDKTSRYAKQFIARLALLAYKNL